jgi:3-oxoacyl-[acyl-carrier protein] reductase
MKPRKVVVVTGASSGIGQATAIEFAKMGWTVVTHGHRNVSGLAETQRRIRDLAGDASVPVGVICDIAALESIRSMVDALFQRFPRIDAWVHAAGADVLTGDAASMSFSEKLARLWEVDVRGTMVLSRMVARRMMLQQEHSTREQDRASVAGGLPSVVHLGWDQSEHGMEGDSGQFFAATKAAVTAFSKSLAKSVGPYVRVNCIAPGWVKTEWGDNAPAVWQQRAKGESLLNRWAVPEDVARCIVAVCSDELSFINGQTIAVNGGWQSMSLSVRSESHWD